MNVERCFDALIFFELPWTAIKMKEMGKKIINFTDVD